jgi:hypothetical protein
MGIHDPIVVGFVKETELLLFELVARLGAMVLGGNHDTLP